MLVDVDPIRYGERPDIYISSHTAHFLDSLVNLPREFGLVTGMNRLSDPKVPGRTIEGCVLGDGSYAGKRSQSKPIVAPMSAAEDARSASQSTRLTMVWRDPYE